MKWRGQAPFWLLSLLSLVSTALAGQFSGHQFDLAAVLLALLGLLSLRPQRR